MKCCVVGCGASGIIAAKHLKDAGIDFDVFEMTDDIGGTWIYTEKERDSYGSPVHTAMYKNLRTNIPKEIMEFKGFQYDTEISFLKSTAVHDYLRNYIIENELTDYIKLGHLVSNISYLQDNSWEVSVTNLENKHHKVLLYNVIMVCNGHHFKPRLPTVKGQEEFQGLQMHSKNYRVPDIFRDKTVLVIGLGPSGQDIACDVSKEAKRIFLSNHDPTFNVDFCGCNVVSKPDLDKLNPNSATFQDGTTENVDAIIYCTGYYYCFPFLDESCGITVDDNYVKPLHRQLINISHPTMAIVGLPFKTFIFPLLEVQVRVFVQLLLGKTNLPDEQEMRKELQCFEKDMEEKGIHRKKYHELVSIEPYIGQLTSMAALEDLPQVLYRIFDCNLKRKHDNLLNYRKCKYTLIDDNEFKIEFVENKVYK